MKCQRQLLQVKWHQFVQNDQISAVTNLPSISSTISRRRNAVFGHITRLDEEVPAHRHCDITSICRSADYLAASGNVLPAGPAAGGSTRSAGTTITPLLQTSGGLPSDVVTVERRYSPRWLRDDDDDEGALALDKIVAHATVVYSYRTIQFYVSLMPVQTLVALGTGFEKTDGRVQSNT